MSHWIVADNNYPALQHSFMKVKAMPQTDCTTTKRCAQCGVEAPVSQFPRNKATKDGLESKCKNCVAAYKAAYYAAHREEIAVKSAAHYVAHREGILAYQAAYNATHKQEVAARQAAYKSANYQKNRDKLIAYHDAYYQKNREKVLASQAIYYQKTREKRLTRHAIYYQATREKIIAKVAAWKKANPEKRRASWHRRRAMERNASGTHTAQQVKDLLIKQRGKCVYCKKDIKKSYHVDHIVALVNGGSNHAHNLQLLCPSCNCSKSAKDPITFAQQRGMLL